MKMTQIMKASLVAILALAGAVGADARERRHDRGHPAVSMAEQGNSSVTIQNGRGNVARTIQRGGANQAEITQEGDANRGRIIQIGDGQNATLHQDGSARTNIIQVNKGNASVDITAGPGGARR